jgi:RHS repeat-associated protein
MSSRTDETRWHIRDNVGTGRIALDQTGSLANVRRNDFLPFGEELTGGVAGRTAARGYAPTNINQKFTGHERDASTGYDHTLWRKLDSVQGRWTSPDPYGGSMEIGNPQSFNRYSYVLNDPVNLMDPLGLNPSRTVCYVDGIQSDCGFAFHMVDIGSAVLEGGGGWGIGYVDENKKLIEGSVTTTYYATNLNLMFRNPFPTERWVLNGLSNTLSDLIGEREIAIAAQQAGNPNESTETRLLGAATLATEIVSNAIPGGGAATRSVSALRTAGVGEVNALRNAFKNGARSKYVKSYSQTTEAARRFSPEQLTYMEKYGKLPKGSNYIVHHKQPLFRGGNNDFDNLKVIRKDVHQKYYDNLHLYPPGKNPYGRN